MEYLIKIIGRLLPEKRPYALVYNKELGGFDKIYELPEEIVQMYAVDFENRQLISKFIEERTVPIIQMQGFLVKDNPSRDDTTRFSSDRKWVPMHMIAYIRAEVRDVQGETPIFDDGGKLKTKDGKDVIIQ